MFLNSLNEKETMIMHISCSTEEEHIKMKDLSYAAQAVKSLIKRGDYKPDETITSIGHWMEHDVQDKIKEEEGQQIDEVQEEINKSFNTINEQHSHYPITIKEIAKKRKEEGYIQQETHENSSSSKKVVVHPEESSIFADGAETGERSVEKKRKRVSAKDSYYEFKKTVLLESLELEKKKISLLEELVSKLVNRDTT